MKRLFALVPLLLVLFVPLSVRGQVPDEKKLDAMVAEAVKAFEAPGAAVVVVHRGQGRLPQGNRRSRAGQA